VKTHGQKSLIHSRGRRLVHSEPQLHEALRRTAVQAENVQHEFQRHIHRYHVARMPATPEPSVVVP
jgi:hypothetical protein